MVPTTEYHQQSNGQMEGFKETMIQKNWKYVRQHQK